jgi:2-oxo-3-hexenedioate decarboxylase
MPDPAALADQLLAAHDAGTLVPPTSVDDPTFDLPAAYDVLDRIADRRRSQGWSAVGRKVGFTNRTIWALYGVDRPIWAHVWDRTLHRAVDGRYELPAAGLVQPRIEPEVVFGLRSPLRPTDDAREVLDAVGWISAGFEIVQCHAPGWRFGLPDCVADFGLHAALVLGSPVELDDAARDALVDRLASFEAVLARGGEDVDRGVGSNVLDSPAFALAHLARVVEDVPDDRLVAGEVVTTGTVTDAHPVQAGETWRASYGDLGVEGFDLTFV